ncbi:pseudouridine synthase, partial [Thamnocephalis sphaerospora]
KKKEARPFDMSKYATRRIALKVSYLGWDYYGFAAQNQNLPTVEARLVDALLACRLITDVKTNRYTRCGRTDRGVSAAGQVIALDEIPWPTPADAAAAEARDAEREIPYLDLLNRQLPSDIRVLAWSPVASDFDARFNCQWRRYRYYFDARGLDLERMRAAAALYVGKRDFRNFCQIDATKPAMNFERHILACNIVPVHSIDDVEVDANGGNDAPPTGRDGNARFYALDLRGTAFLWHQVRCMMAILFLVGQRLEPVDTVAAMLDPARLAGRPAYDMASELPLVLHHCAFPDDALRWRY